MATTSILIKKAEERTKKCARCGYEFTRYCKLYKHLYENKTDCDPQSNISIEEARVIANIPLYYKCKYCEEVVLDINNRHKHEDNCNFKNIIECFEDNNIDPTISYLFTIDEEGKVISNIDKDTGYINATLLCKSSKKEWYDYINNVSTKEFIIELQKYNKNNNLGKETDNTGNCTHFEELIIQKESLLNLNVKHIYVCEDIAINLAQWCSPRYGIIVSRFIKNYRNGLLSTEDSKKAKQNIQDIQEDKKELYILKTCLDCIEANSCQFYFRSTNLHINDIDIYDTKGNKIIDNYIILKGGSQGENTGRQKRHIGKFKTSSLIDSFKCYNYLKLEEYVKEKAKELNKLCIIKSPEDYKGNEYYIFKDQDDYNNFALIIKEKMDELNKNILLDLQDNHNTSILEIEKEKTKQKEYDTKQEEYKLNIEKEKTKHLELQIKLSLIKHNQSINKNNDISIIDKIKEETIITKEEHIQIENNEDLNAIDRRTIARTNCRLPICNFDRNRDKKVKYFGVTETKSRSGVITYKARLFVNNKLNYLGTYRTPELAGYAYDCARIDIYGNDYETNKIEKPEDWEWNPALKKLEYKRLLQ